MSDIPSTKKGNYCVFIVVDRFPKMKILSLCKNSITSNATTKLFFTHVWVNFFLRWTIISDRYSRFMSTFWSNLWSMMDTKLRKSISFHPQTDRQTKVVKRMIVHILRMYNSKHPCTWDEIIPYIQHIYNKYLHNSIGHIPFYMCLEFQPLAPMDVDLPITIAHEESFHDEKKVDRVAKFVECIQHIQQQVHDIFHISNDEYKQRHDQHRVPHKF